MTLQWGRNLFVAESPQQRQGEQRGIDASMGPQLVRCGKRFLVREVFTPDLRASMGPQLVRCGK